MPLAYTMGVHSVIPCISCGRRGKAWTYSRVEILLPSNRMRTGNGRPKVLSLVRSNGCVSRGGQLMSRRVMVEMIIAAIVTTFSLHVSADQVLAPGTVACADPFGRDTRSDLVRTFGAANVVDQEIEGHGGAGWLGTVIYPNDPRRRLEILWGDEVNRRLLAAIWIRGESEWTGWRKVHIGMTLEEVEGLNGKPFKLKDFDTDDAGRVTAWQGGAMERIPGECRFLVRFEPDDDAPSDAFAELTGELVSSDPKVRSLRLTVSEIYTFYPK
jgi:hypothetical protein